MSTAEIDVNNLNLRHVFTHTNQITNQLPGFIKELQNKFDIPISKPQVEKINNVVTNIVTWPGGI